MEETINREKHNKHPRDIIHQFNKDLILLPLQLMTKVGLIPEIRPNFIKFVINRSGALSLQHLSFCQAVY